MKLRELFFNLTKKRAALILLSLIVALAAGFRLWSDRPVTVTKNLFAMGTVFEITVSGKNAPAAIESAFAEIKRIEAVTQNDGNSDLARINRNSGINPVKVGPEIIAILTVVKKHYPELAGAFDPTIGPLVNLWGFGPNGEPRLPSAKDIVSRLPLVDFNQVRINREEQTVYLAKSDMRLDLGGIAKGYAVDRVYQIFKKRRIKSALINGGSSSIRVIGKKGTTDWALGIGHPRRAGKLLGILNLPGDRALGTSADTQNFFIKDGKRYSHLINPKTGFPARDKILVTVTAPTAVAADLLSTAFFILPSTKLEAYPLNHPAIKAVIFNASNKLINLGETTFKKTVIDPPTPYSY